MTVFGFESLKKLEIEHNRKDDKLAMQNII